MPFLPVNMGGVIISMSSQEALLGLNETQPDFYFAPLLVANDPNTGVLKGFLMYLRIFGNLKGLQLCTSERFATN